MIVYVTNMGCMHEMFRELDNLFDLPFTEKTRVKIIALCEHIRDYV